MSQKRTKLLASAPLRALRGVGPKRERQLAELGLTSVGDLLTHLPRGYEDRRYARPISEVEAGAGITTVGILGKARRVFTRRRGLRIIEATLEDATGSLRVFWFNQPYLLERLEDEMIYRLHGSVRERGGTLEMINPSLEPATTPGRLVPLYGKLGEVPAGTVARWIGTAFEELADSEPPDPLPPTVLARRALQSVGAALRNLHLPGEYQVDPGALLSGSTEAHRRLAYGELLGLRLRVEEARQTLAGRTRTPRCDSGVRDRDRWMNLPEFVLTTAQKRVLGEIFDDFQGPCPMQRLVQGDVGSGKTVVAAIAAAGMIEAGFQVAVLAPTELLAEQHFSSFRRLLEPTGSTVGLFTANSAGNRLDLENGRVDLAVGTHALLQESIRFKRLGLVVVDEQQRFGVRQRRRLVETPDPAELLVMTATPIPRSLAMTLYGDLQVSVIDELPPGRRDITTVIVPLRRRREVYQALARRLSEDSGQAYVVFPLIEESDANLGAALLREGEQAMRWLRPHRCAMVHGRQASAERSSTMEAFAAGEIRALLATSVIEVGVDVPNATFMVIEGAERFGLAQLHQLRGRIGRGTRDSSCVAIHGDLTDTGEQRLEVFARTCDGFEIARADLTIRGPGEILGSLQAGAESGLALRAGVEHPEWLEEAVEDAQSLAQDLAPEERLALMEALCNQPLPDASQALSGG